MSAGDLQARIAIDRTESELEQVASTLNDAFDRLQRAVEQERRFTADASHELRTPISVLRAEADWALDRERTPQQYRDALAVCRRAALRMQAAIERMLALVRAESGGGMRDVGPVDIGSVIAGVVEWLSPVAQERRVRLAVSGTTFTVSGDAEQLREAFTNVVANAILYNKPDGSVTVSMRAGETAGCIEIVDTGIGIPKDAVPQVFDRFFRVDGARSRSAYRGAVPPSGAGEGSGLGLSIARAIIVAHHGEITCTSEDGTGSVFVISLPVFSAPDQADERVQTSESHVSSTRPAAGSRERG
jgi:signal transduction histidine kinase